MTKLSQILIIVASTLTVGCSYAKIDPTGQWTREAVEPAANLSGTEILEFRHDSIVIVTNNMTFAHKDSLISCKLTLTITADGTWSLNKNSDIILQYDSATVAVKGDFNSFILNSANHTELPAEIITKTYDDICREITGYYKYGYGSISQAGGIWLTAPRITETEMSALINETPVKWVRKPNLD